MTQSASSKTDLDTEMTVVRNEFEMGENSPQRVLLEARCRRTAFHWHNYGNVDHRRARRHRERDIDRLRAFYRTYYQPDNAVLIVAGTLRSPPGRSS